MCFPESPGPEKGQTLRAMEFHLCGGVCFARIPACTYTRRPERSTGPPSTVSQCRFCSPLLTERIPLLQLLLKNVVWLCARNRFRKGQRAVHPSQERRGENRRRQIWHFSQIGYKTPPETVKTGFFRMVSERMCLTFRKCWWSASGGKAKCYRRFAIYSSQYYFIYK